MLFEALIYFFDYQSIVQANVDLKELSVKTNYCEDMLFHFLDNDLNLNICKSWVKYLDDKSLLTPYLIKYSRDSEWVELLLTFYPQINYTYNNNELLVSCCRHGHLNLVKWLVTNGANIRVRDYQAFQYACIYGHLETAKYLLSLNDAVDERKLCVQSGNNYALRWSADAGHLGIVKWLVSNGANIRVNDYQPFGFACKHGQMGIAQYLFDLIDDMEERKLCVQSDTSYALRRSAKGGHLEIVKWLVNNGADIRARDYRPFRCACIHGHLETAKYLLSLIDTDEEKKLCIQSDNNCALKWSARCDYLNIVKWLVSNGANIKVNDYEPFRCACEDGHLETAKYLLDLIDTDDKEKKLCVQSDDNYALRWSANNGHIEVVKWLVSNGADIRIRDYQPFRYACRRGHLEIAKYLLYLIDIDDEEKKLCIHSDNNYALRWSASMGHLEVVKWLVNNGVNIRVNRRRLFRYACKYGHLETAVYLLSLIDTIEEKKLCVESDDNHALRWSAESGYLEVVKWLVNNGANIRANNYQAFAHACEDGHLETAKYLLSLIDTDEEKKLCIHTNGNHALRCSASDGHFDVVKWLVNNGADVRINCHQIIQSVEEIEIRDYLLNQLTEEERLEIINYLN